MARCSVDDQIGNYPTLDTRPLNIRRQLIEPHGGSCAAFSTRSTPPINPEGRIDAGRAAHGTQPNCECLWLTPSFNGQNLKLNCRTSVTHRIETSLLRHQSHLKNVCRGIRKSQIWYRAPGVPARISTRGFESRPEPAEPVDSGISKQYGIVSI